MFYVASLCNLRHLIYKVSGAELALPVTSGLVVGAEITVDAFASWAPGGEDDDSIRVFSEYARRLRWGKKGVLREHSGLFLRLFYSIDCGHCLLEWGAILVRLYECLKTFVIEN